MLSVIITDDYGFSLNNIKTLLQGKESLFLHCAEIHEDRLGNPESQIYYSFGLTTLGGFTVELGNREVERIVKFNYKVEENNEVGLCAPYNLLIAPRKFFSNIFSNIYDEFTHKCVQDIIEANEKYQKCENIYVELREGEIYGSANFQTAWLSEEVKSASLQNLINSLKLNDCIYTKKVFLLCWNS